MKIDSLLLSYVYFLWVFNPVPCKVWDMLLLPKIENERLIERIKCPILCKDDNLLFCMKISDL